jgi:hypothetical protein
MILMFSLIAPSRFLFDYSNGRNIIWLMLRYFIIIWKHRAARSNSTNCHNVAVCIIQTCQHHAQLLR